MRCRAIAVFLAVAFLNNPAAAEVRSASESGFESVVTIDVAAAPDKAYAVIADPSLWWDATHSYSGDAHNLAVDARPGGCFCERLPGGGGVEHARVVFAQPGKMLRLAGALGPLQAEAVNGTLTFAISQPDKANGQTRITVTYVVGGYARGGLSGIAPIVDGVLGQQIARLKQALEK